MIWPHALPKKIFVRRRWRRGPASASSDDVSLASLGKPVSQATASALDTPNADDRAEIRTACRGGCPMRTRESFARKPGGAQH